MNGKLLTEIETAQRFFSDTKYAQIVENAVVLFNSGKEVTAGLELGKLPTEEQLLNQLIEKLKGKSVYKTLKRVARGGFENSDRFLKGLFSLGTHIVVEVEQGRSEYRMLLPVIYGKIGKILYDTS